MKSLFGGLATLGLGSASSSSAATAVAGAAGSTQRLVAVDEGSLGWKRRSGRKDGPDSYVHGDLSASVFRETARMSVRERNESYGGSVLLVGVLEARGLLPLDSNGRSDPYATLQLLDEDGHELKERTAHNTRTLLETVDPDWDELFALGQGRVDISAAATLRVKLSDYDSPVRFEKPEGVVDIPMSLVREEADVAANGGWWDAWFDVTAASGMHLKGGSSAPGGLGRLHLLLLLHTPPQDPRPLSVAIRVAHGVDLLSADSNGFSDPYVKVKPMLGARHALSAATKKAAELVTSIKKVTLNPVWQEILVFNDASLGGVADLNHTWATPWGWPSAVPADLGSLPVQQLSVLDLRSTSELLFVLKDHDWGKVDDDLGEVVVRLGSLFGDEEAVVCGRTLRVDRWFRVRPHKGMAAQLEGKLGMLHLDIVVRFGEELLPQPWVEAVESESGDNYYYNQKTRKSHWQLPGSATAAVAAAFGSGAGARPLAIAEHEDEDSYADGEAGADDEDVERKAAAAAAAAEAAALAAAACIGHDTIKAAQPHKPPRPCVPSPSAHAAPFEVTSSFRRPAAPVGPSSAELAAAAEKEELVREELRASQPVVAFLGDLMSGKVRLGGGGDGSDDDVNSEDLEEEEEEEDAEEVAAQVKAQAKLLVAKAKAAQAQAAAQAAVAAAVVAAAAAAEAASEESSAPHAPAANATAAPAEAPASMPAPVPASVPAPAPAPAPAPPAFSLFAAAPATLVSAVPVPIAEDEGDDAGVVVDAAAVAATVAAVPLGRAREDAVAESIANPLAAMAGGVGLVGMDRKKVFFEQMRKNAEAKRGEEEAQQRAKVASMTSEERADFDREAAAEARRAQRAKRMTSTLAAGYGSASARTIMGGRGGARPSMRGGARGVARSASGSGADEGEGEGGE